MTSGLVQHYDGINNTSSGHSSSATVWKDLAGTNDGILKPAIGGNLTWTSNCLQFSSGAVVFSGEITNFYTIMGVALAKDVGTYPRIVDGSPINGTNNNTFPGFYIVRTDGASQASKIFRIYGHGLDAPFVPTVPAIFDKRFHYAYRFDGAKIDLFINGEWKGSINSTAVPNDKTSVLLGAGDISGRYLSGEICNFMRYDRALTSSEIAQNALVDNMRFINPSSPLQIT